MREQFENRKLTGNLKIGLTRKDDSSTKNYWYGKKEVIAAAILRIATDYARQGYTLSLRQLYYQLVTENAIVNDEKLYLKVGKIKDDLAYAGKLDWSYIEDRTRRPYEKYSVSGIENAMQDTVEQYRLNRQKDQPVEMEIWAEKDAISSILRRVSNEFQIRMRINKGYSSSSAFYSSYEQIAEALNNGYKFYIFYFGDHDPSGLDMVRDIRERLTFMLENGIQLNDEGHENLQNGYFKVIQVGLTMQQIKKYNPPQNPAKLDDPRAAEYVEKYGPVSWEVDALKPPVIIEIVRGWVMKYLDEDLYNKMLRKEKRHIKYLQDATTKALEEIGEDSTEEDSDEDIDDDE
jgi:hypothetical protein